MLPKNLPLQSHIVPTVTTVTTYNKKEIYKGSGAVGGTHDQLYNHGENVVTVVTAVSELPITKPETSGNNVVTPTTEELGAILNDLA